MSTEHLALSPERASFRKRYNARLVQDREEGSNLRSLADGIYGFTTSPATEEIPVFGRPIYQCFEVIRPAGGDVVIVGYLSERDSQALQNSMEPVNVRLFPEPYEDATKLSAVPHSRIDRAKPPSRDHGNWITLELSPKTEFRGIGSTAN